MTANISVCQETLIASIRLSETNDKLINELKILCSNLSDNYSFHNNTFMLPWFELRRGITSIAYVLKQELVNVIFDSFSTELISEIITDRQNIKQRRASFEIGEDEFENYLSESNFQRTLKPEQKRDALKLLSLRHGANFSVPGAGKTTTILAVHSILKKISIVNKLIVISPINAFISWEDEIDEIYKDNKPKIVRLNKFHFEDSSILKKEDPDILLVNYEKLRRNINEIVPFFINNKVHLILDESHRIKSGVNNISFNQIIKLADIAKRRDILSGTPMPQSYLDLEPQFDYLWPGENIIKSQSDKDENIVIANINTSINKLFVRTTKNELGLTPPVVKYTTVPMGPIQSELYRLFKSETARVIAGIDKPNMYTFRRIGKSVVKLLQAATNPMLLSLKDDYTTDTLPIPNNKEYWELLEDFRKYEKPVKIEYLIKRVKEITSENPENKVLIWTYFVRNILILEKIFKEYNPVTIYGGIPSGSDEEETNREGRIRKFHDDPSCKIMIANPQACGEGISLHKICHYAIYLDRNFNSAFYLQSIDRIHRLGLPKEIDTNIEILISENSIEELLISRLNDKIKAMGDVLDDPYLHSLAYDPADIPIEDEVGIDMKDFEVIKEHVNSK
ncbi:DEAD/DEAH box helicase [Lascolabacillus massiliensis]|uniref:DEAD/DEAH box helicase n=1 Tax=Lascolabacillus massiliensis TaxID=1627894 RepID=UPI0009E8234B|nr:DEAD/DEAH box helicase [Lascolabacillus massiliensis]